MTELVFQKKGNYYVTEVEVNNIFCIQLNRKESGRLYMNLSLSEDLEWSPAKLPEDVRYMENANILWTFDTGVYPMRVQLLSQTEVVKGNIQEVEE